MRTPTIGAIAAALTLFGSAPDVGAEWCPCLPPAANLDAYYYESRGGIREPGWPSVYNGYDSRRAPARCGPNLRWKDGRCVEIH